MPIWKEIHGYPDYAISDDGQVKSLRFNRTLKLPRNKGGKGYQYVNLLKDRIKKTTAVHKLVIEHFGSAKPGENFVVDHIDTDKTNNKISNLEWVSIQENTLRYYANNTKREQVLEMRQAGYTLQQIAASVGKSISFVQQTIARGY
jgi:hypothetical protein